MPARRSAGPRSGEASTDHMAGKADLAVVAEAAVGRLPVTGVSRVTLSQVDISAVVAPTETVVAHVFARADHGPRQG